MDLCAIKNDELDRITGVQDAMRRVQDFLRNSGYTFTQMNGSRITQLFQGREPGKGCEIFVSNIPNTVFEDELIPIFSNVGSIYQIRLMMCFSGVNKGYAYIQYLNKEEAKLAVKELNGFMIRPKKYLKVEKSLDNCRLFFGNIPRDLTRETIENDLTNLLKDSGLTKVFVYADPTNRNHNRGFVFVDFKTHRDAAIARRTFSSKALNLWGNNINVDWAKAEKEVDDEIMPVVST